MLALGPKLLTPDLKDRIAFTNASFFEPQKHLGAAAYLIRQCTHNWADAEVVKIFKSMVPALEGSAPGTPFLINDIILPEPGTTMERIWERERRHVDMVMLICNGAKERTVKDFDKLLRQADERFVIKKVYNEDHGSLGMIEAYLNNGTNGTNGTH
jgi:hypothetical protein